MDQRFSFSTLTRHRLSSITSSRFGSIKGMFFSVYGVRFWVLLFWLLALRAVDVRADTVVVFNEVMYHPQTNELHSEWIELQNILARDIDMTGWSLDGGVQYNFSKGFVLRGGAFVVIASDPEALRSKVTGTNLLGPFTGRLSNSGDKIILRDNQERLMDELEYSDDDPWPSGPDGGGVSLVKRKNTLATSEPKSWTISSEIGGSPGRSNSVPSSATLLFNEIPAGSTADFWIEIMNRSADPVDIGGHVIASSTGTEAVLSKRIVGAGEIALVSQGDLGFIPQKGEKLFFYAPGKSALLDAAVIHGNSRGRNTQIPDQWLNETTLTPGNSNQFTLHDEIVINEIMYHPRFLQKEIIQPAGGYIELYNRGKRTVDLSGWSLRDGGRFDFPFGTMMAPDSYLVIAENSDYLTNLYADIRVLGNLGKKLSHTSARILLVDDLGNPANDATYYGGNPWPEAADGGGSSLELRDPRADNNNPLAWAASDETGRSEWKQYIYRGIAGPNHTGKTYQEFILSLLDRGEVLLDNISVVEDPENNPAQLIQNGTFENGLGSWRIIGTHHGEVIPDPTNSGNKVMHLSATGPATDLHNHMETTLKKGSTFATIVPGREYQISFRAKWLSGSVLLNTRLFFNRVFRTTLIDAPIATGTPGRRNSRYQSNIGPTLSNLRQKPLLPRANEAVQISIDAADPDRVLSVEVWRSTGKEWTNFAMQTLDGRHFTVELPGLPAGAIGQFYIQATDNTDASSTYPAGGSNAPAFYQVAASASPKNVHTLRILMRPEDAAFLIQPQNIMSAEHLNATILWNDDEAYYNAGIRLKGAPSSRSGSLAGYHIQFPKDHLFLGVHGPISIDRNNPSEILTKHLNQIAGIPSMYNDAIYVIAPQSARTGYGQIRMAAFGDVYLGSQFKNGNDGPSYEKELIYMPDTTTTGTPEGYKIPSPYEHPPELNTDIADYGPDKESYRWNWLLNNNQDQDEYRRIVQLNQTFSLTGAALARAVPDIIDVDQWLRTFAMVRLIGCRDFYSQPGGPPGSWNHNFIPYVRPADNRVLALPWDIDESFQEPINGSLIGNMNLAKIISIPANLRLTYGHYYDLITRFYTRDYMTRWGNHFASLLPATDFNGPINYILQRENYVVAQLPPKVPFAFSIPAPSAVITSNYYTLTGSAWIDLKRIQVIGAVPTPVLRWPTVTHWEVDLPLLLGRNDFQFFAYNFANELLASNSISLISSAKDGGLDSDADGLPDAWEAQYNFPTTVANASDDPDRDGMTNLQEYLAGTNPTDATSRLELVLSSNPPQLNFDRQAGRAYTIQSTADLSTDWQTIAQFPAQLQPEEMALPLQQINRAAFYRLLIELTSGP
jgi:hypothetical protein